MAPELALSELKKLPRGSSVLDPMAGSGTVLKHAADLGHNAIGIDTDPLAVLMSRVLTRRVDAEEVNAALKVTSLAAVELRQAPLPWMDDDAETSEFAEYWFGDPQRQELRGLAAALALAPALGVGEGVADVLRISLSRTIITKDRGASLARDVSHSRPHKVATSSTYSVLDGFRRSTSKVLKVVTAGNATESGSASIALGDARAMPQLKDASVDAIITSPPYLNAIDYMRGHRLSLIWLGYGLRELRAIRAENIGTERRATTTSPADVEIRLAMTNGGALTPRNTSMVDRYLHDLDAMMAEAARVSRPQARATFVIGDSAIDGVFIQNSLALARLGTRHGFDVEGMAERELPRRHRYLPIPQERDKPLGARLRTETAITLVRAA